MTSSFGPLAAGDKVGSTQIEAEVGRGAFATVYRAYDERFASTVAVKVLSEHHAAEPDTVERFVQEARALRSVDSDSVVSVFDVDQTTTGLPYMILRYADRGTLADRLSLGRAATTDDLRRLVDFFERALGALHRQQLVHRDVKPANVLLTAGAVNPDVEFGMFWEDDHLLLGDLGLVKDVSFQRVTRGAGSTAYAAPEQLAVVSNVDQRADIYAASAVIAEAAVGRLRTDGEPWSAVFAEVSDHGRPELVSALARGLAKEPDQRFTSIHEWAEQMRRSLTPIGAAAGSGGTGQGLRFSLPALVAAVALVIAAPLFYFLLRGGGGATTAPIQDVAGVQVTPTAVEATTAEPAATPGESAIEASDVASPGGEGTASADTSGDGETTANEAEDAGPACVDRADPTGLISGLAASRVADTAIAIVWEPMDPVQALDIVVDGEYLDSTRRYEGAGLRVIEDLEPGRSYLIALESGSSRQAVCVSTATEPSGPIDDFGPLKPTGFRVVTETPDSITVTWDLRSGADWHNLFIDGKYQQDPPSSVKGDNTEWTFTGLEPDTEYLLGLRRLEDPNNSGLVEITARTTSDDGSTEGAVAEPARGSADTSNPAGDSGTPSGDSASTTEAASGGLSEDAPGTAATPAWEPASPDPNGPHPTTLAAALLFGGDRQTTQPPGLSVPVSTPAAPVVEVAEAVVGCVPDPVGPAGSLSVAATTSTAVLISLIPNPDPLNVFVDGQYHDTLRPNSSTYAIEGLLPATAYELTIAIGADPDSGNRLCVVTDSSPSAMLPESAATAPVDVVVVAATATTATISWTVTAPLADHIVFITDPGAIHQHPQVVWAGRVGPGQDTFTVEGLVPSSTYQVGVRALLEPNRSNIAFVQVTTEAALANPPAANPTPTPSPEPTPTVVALPMPPTPTCVSSDHGEIASGMIESVHDGAITIRWDAVDVGLNLFATPADVEARYYVDSTPPGADRYVIEGLLPATEYVVEIATFDEGLGEGSELCAMTLGVGEGVAPTGAVRVNDLVVESFTATTLTVSWSAVDEASCYRLIIGDPVADQTPAITAIRNVPASETTFTFSDLDPGRTVVVGVQSVVDNNRSGLVYVTVELPS